MRAPAALLVLVLVAPAAAADHPGSNLGLALLEDLPGQPPVVGKSLVHRLPTVDAKLAAWEAKWPDLVERQTIGKTTLGFPLLSVRVTDETVPYEQAPLSTGTKVRVYLDGGHHGNEFLGVELVMYWLEDLLTKADAGDEATLAFLRETEVHATPIVNVEGNFADTRKNSRLVDPNRNYDFHWGEEGSGDSPLDFTYRGTAPESEPEVKANADLQRALRPDVVVTMHTGIAEFYWPWGWTHDPSPDDALFTSMEEPFEAATNGRVDAMQGAELYIVAGASDDWAYGVLGAAGFTYEVHEHQFLPVYGQPIPDLIADQLAGLDWVVRNARHIGAWVELREEDGRWVAANDGWGVARGVVVASGGASATLPDVPPGGAVEVPLAVGADATWTYPTLLVETSKVREHRLEPLAPAASGAEASVPALGLVAAALAAVGAALLRRR